MDGQALLTPLLTNCNGSIDFLFAPLMVGAHVKK
jgi:hypothetical protein